MPDLRSRIHGCLLGGAVGDALGWPVEFNSLGEIRARFGPDGPRGFADAPGGVGAVTDDTQMTLFTAEGLVRAAARSRERGICHPPSVVHHAYLRWLHTQGEASAHPLFRPDAFDGLLVGERRLFAVRAPGPTCLGALRGAEMGTVEAPVNDRKGCGGVMRAAPVGLVTRPDRAFEMGCETAAITHGHPTGFLAAGALALAVAHLAEGASLDDALDTAEARLGRERGGAECLDALRAARGLAAAGGLTPEVVETLGGGWTADEALAIAAACALDAGRAAGPEAAFERGVRTAVTHSGDSDSTGAVAGNLLGALGGVDAIPARWRAAVELADVAETVADALVDVAEGRPTDWNAFPGW